MCFFLPATWTFVQKLIKANEREVMKALYYWSLMQEIPAENASNAECVSKLWRHLHIYRHMYRAGPHLNIKTVLSTYDDFHVKDKTAVRTSYL